MRLFMYSVRDTVAGVFMAPYLAQNDAVARRSFLASKSQLVGPGSDYELVLVGAFDSNLGVVAPLDHQLVCRGDDDA